MIKNAIEEKKEKLEAQKARLLSKEQKIKAEERKKQLQKLISLGQLITENGLDVLDRTVLLGALLEIKERFERIDDVEAWEIRGKLAIEQNKPTRAPAIVTFQNPPNNVIRSILKNSGLKWNPFRQEWQGFSDLASLRESLKTTNANIQEISIA